MPAPGVPRLALVGQKGLVPGCYRPTRPISAGCEPLPATGSAASRARGPTNPRRKTNSRRRMRRFASSATVWCQLATSQQPTTSSPTGHESPPPRHSPRGPRSSGAPRVALLSAPRGRSLTLRETARPGPPQRLFPRARSCGGFPPGGLSRYARTSPRPGGNTCRTCCRLQRPR